VGSRFPRPRRPKKICEGHFQVAVSSGIHNNELLVQRARRRLKIVRRSSADRHPISLYRRDEMASSPKRGDGAPEHAAIARVGSADPARGVGKRCTRPRRNSVLSSVPEIDTSVRGAAVRRTRHLAPTIQGMTVIDRSTISVRFLGRFPAHGLPISGKCQASTNTSAQGLGAPVDRRGPWFF